MDEDLMNEVAYEPRTLQPHEMDTTEIKENLEKWKEKTLFVRKMSEIFVSSLT